MRAILINPFDRTVTEIEVSGDWRSVSEAVGADYLDLVKLDQRHDLWVDDEGLFKEDQQLFWIQGFPAPLAGMAVILGHDNRGESADATAHLSMISQRISWWDGSRRLPAEIVALLGG